MFQIDTVSDRIIAARDNLSIRTMLVIVGHMPVDYGNALDEYINELGFLEGLLDNEVYDYVVILADFNTDLHTQDGHCSKY